MNHSVPRETCSDNPRWLSGMADIPPYRHRPLWPVAVFENVAPPASTRPRPGSDRGQAGSLGTHRGCVAMVPTVRSTEPMRALTLCVAPNPQLLAASASDCQPTTV